MKTVALVRMFHALSGLPIEEKPNITNKAVNNLRMKLLWEELQELEDALNSQDKVAVIDALTDIQYVLDGAYVSLGFQHLKDAAFYAVHNSNISKLEGEAPPTRTDGKILKGKNYRPPTKHLQDLVDAACS